MSTTDYYIFKKCLIVTNLFLNFFLFEDCDETSLTYLIFKSKSAACKSKLFASASDQYQYKNELPFIRYNTVLWTTYSWNEKNVGPNLAHNLTFNLTSNMTLKTFYPHPMLKFQLVAKEP